MRPIPDKDVEQTKCTLKGGNPRSFPLPVGSRRGEGPPPWDTELAFLGISRRNLGSWWRMVYLSHQLRSTFMVIVLYRLIDFYILSESGSHTPGLLFSNLQCGQACSA